MMTTEPITLCQRPTEASAPLTTEAEPRGR